MFRVEMRESMAVGEAAVRDDLALMFKRPGRAPFVEIVGDLSPLL
jgi:hypothetical protein